MAVRVEDLPVALAPERVLKRCVHLRTRRKRPFPERVDVVRRDREGAVGAAEGQRRDDAVLGELVGDHHDVVAETQLDLHEPIAGNRNAAADLGSERALVPGRSLAGAAHDDVRRDPHRRHSLIVDTVRYRCQTRVESVTNGSKVPARDGSSVGGGPTITSVCRGAPAPRGRDGNARLPGVASSATVLARPRARRAGRSRSPRRPRRLSRPSLERAGAAVLPAVRADRDELADVARARLAPSRAASSFSTCRPPPSAPPDAGSPPSAATSIPESSASIHARGAGRRPKRALIRALSRNVRRPRAGVAAPRSSSSQPGTGRRNSSSLCAFSDGGAASAAPLHLDHEVETPSSFAAVLRGGDSSSACGVALVRRAQMPDAPG